MQAVAEHSCTLVISTKPLSGNNRCACLLRFYEQLEIFITHYFIILIYSDVCFLFLCKTEKVVAIFKFPVLVLDIITAVYLIYPPK
jgi:hypothetical protein